MEFDRSIDISHLRRIALIADTHGPIHLGLLPAILKHDCIVHAGDIGGLQGLEIGDMPFHGVVGNNDTLGKWPKSEARVLKSLPQSMNLQLRGGCLAVIHGHQYPAVKTRHEKLRTDFPDAKAVLYGHSHRPTIDQSGQPWVLNPGAAGRIRAHESAGFVSLKVSERGWRLERIKVALK